MSSLDKFQQLESLMMGYDKCGLYWNKEMKMWMIIMDDEEHTSTLIDKKLDRLIRLLMHSHL